MVCDLYSPLSGMPVRDWLMAPLSKPEVWLQNVRCEEERPGGCPDSEKSSVLAIFGEIQIACQATGARN